MSAGTGYPDFQAVPQWHGPVIAAQNYSVTTVTPMTKTSWVPHYSSIQFYVDAGNGQGITFSVDYYTDATLAFRIGSFAWQVWAAKVQAVIPVLGPYAVFTWKTNNAGANGGVTYVALSNIPVPKPQYMAGFVQQESQSFSVPANTTSQFALGDIMTGIAYLFARALDSSAKLQVFVNELDDTGARVGTLMENDALTGDINLTGLARERVLQLNVFNTDTVTAHPLAFRLALASQ